MGIDPCGKAIEAVREKGLLAVREYFGSKNFLKPETENEYDMIVASSVLDRVADLNDVITTIKHLLRPNGHFIFEVHYLGALTKNREIVSHELAYYFSITSLQRLFEERAMTVIDFQDIYSRPNLIRVHVENNNVDAEKEVWDRIDKESKTIASLEYLKEKLK
jgi:predicted TPR repeat methyltransferase